MVEKRTRSNPEDQSPRTAAELENKLHSGNIALALASHRLNNETANLVQLIGIFHEYIVTDSDLPVVFKQRGDISSFLNSAVGSDTTTTSTTALAGSESAVNQSIREAVGNNEVSTTVKPPKVQIRKTDISADDINQVTDELIALQKRVIEIISK